MFEEVSFALQIELFLAIVLMLACGVEARSRASRCASGRRCLDVFVPTVAFLAYYHMLQYGGYSRSWSLSGCDMATLK